MNNWEADDWRRDSEGCLSRMVEFNRCLAAQYFNFPIGIWRQKKVKNVGLCYVLHFEPSRVVIINPKRKVSFPLKIKLETMVTVHRYTATPGAVDPVFQKSISARITICSFWFFEHSRFVSGTSEDRKKELVDIIREYQGMFQKLEIPMKLALKEAFDLAGVNV